MWWFLSPTSIGPSFYSGISRGHRLRRQQRLLRGAADPARLGVPSFSVRASPPLGRADRPPALAVDDIDAARRSSARAASGERVFHDAAAAWRRHRPEGCAWSNPQAVPYGSYASSAILTVTDGCSRRPGAAPGSGRTMDVCGSCAPTRNANILIVRGGRPRTTGGTGGVHGRSRARSTPEEASGRCSLHGGRQARRRLASLRPARKTLDEWNPVC